MAKGWSRKGKDEIGLSRVGVAKGQRGNGRAG